MLGAVVCFSLWVTLGWPLGVAVLLALVACAAWGVLDASFDLGPSPTEFTAVT